ncbi:AarF/UbiB family protein [Rhizobium jaguaris]|uniref:ABC1 kinase family protein n=1 Tax=Rhizobium jaguaris TaxID=1312183 RepID=UPI0039BF4155
MFHIVFVAMAFALGTALRRLCLLPSKPPSSERFRLSLERLGTTFIKFGQALSIRRDILPDDYVVALQKLQDHVSTFPTSVAVQEIERGLGRPVAQLFAEFEESPLAAASVAQVHGARLRDGRSVIVKVRRPGLKRQINQDMRSLFWLVRVATVFIPSLRHYQPMRIIAEIWTNLLKEIDFCREARHIRSFVTAFTEWPQLKIPDVVDGLVCETVVVQERISGLRIDDASLRSDGPRLAGNFVDAYLHQIFVLGVFHGDPHPGNIFVTEDRRLCLHDFGIVGFLDRPMRRKLAAFAMAFVRQDADWLLEAAIDLGILSGEMDRSEFRRGLVEILGDYAALPLKDWSLAEAFLRVTRLAQAQNVFVPLDLLVLMRAMFLAEHTVRILDPEFQLLESLQTKAPDVLKAAMQETDWATTLSRLRLDAASAARDVPSMLSSWVEQLVQEGRGLGLSLHVRELKGLHEHLDRSSNRLALGLVAAGLFVSGALLMGAAGPRIFGEIPLSSAIAFALALWFTLRLVHAIARSGGL